MPQITILKNAALGPFQTFLPSAAKVRFDEDFPMRARVQSFGLARLWPALENLSGRKPRGLVGIYGERVLSVGPVTAVDAFFFRLKVAILAFHESVCPSFNPCCCRIVSFVRSAGSLSTREFGRCG